MKYANLFSHPVITEPISSTDASAPVANKIFQIRLSIPLSHGSTAARREQSREKLWAGTNLPTHNFMKAC
jgi:hypothetical protein